MFQVWKNPSYHTLVVKKKYLMSGLIFSSDILAIIFSSLKNKKDLLCAGQINAQCRNVVKTYHLWHKYCLNILPYQQECKVVGFSSKPSWLFEENCASKDLECYIRYAFSGRQYEAK